MISENNDVLSYKEQSNENKHISNGQQNLQGYRYVTGSCSDW